ncbi:MAG: hypothetical protein ACYCR3_11420, partial [Acidithiobacillus sp.]
EETQMSLLHELAAKIKEIFGTESTIEQAEHEWKVTTANEIARIEADFRAFKVAAEARISALEGERPGAPVPKTAA